MALNGLQLGYLSNVALGIFLLALALATPRVVRLASARWWLAAYLALVGINYVVGAIPFLQGAVVFIEPQLAIVTRHLDPPTLVLFALAATGTRIELSRAALAFAPWIALLGLYEIGAGKATLTAVALVVYYVGAFAILTRRYLRASDLGERDRLGLLVVAFGVITLPRIALLWIDGQFMPGADARYHPLSLSMEAALVASWVALAITMRQEALGARWPHARRVLVATAGLLVALDVDWLLRFVPILREASFALLYSTRWFLFLGVVSWSLQRHDLLAMRPGPLRALRVAYAALLAIAASVMIAVLISTIPGTDTVVAILGGIGVVGLVMAAGAALRLALPRATSELEYRRAAVYRAHLELGSPAPELERVRAELGITQREAREIAATVTLAREIPVQGLPTRVEAGATFLDRYRVERSVGAGAFGRVYAAIDVVSGERVVLKELLPAWRDAPEAFQRFRREVETSLRIRHPNLVEFRSVERIADGFVLVLAHVEGETLAARLERGPLSVPEATKLARGLLSGLAELHAFGILHRDIKPENIMIKPDGEAVLLDFGSVTQRDGSTRLGAHPGTPEYASPEQSRGEALAPASDVYSAALVLWRSLSGSLAPAGTVPAPWRDPLRQALEHDAAKRPVGAVELAAMLRIGTSVALRPR